MRKTTMRLGVAVACLLTARFSVLAEEKAPNLLSFSLTLGGEYTDNRDSNADKENNFEISVSPRVDFTFDSPRTVLDIHYGPSYRYWSDPREDQNENQLYHDAGIKAVHMLSDRARVDVGEQYNYTDDPAVDEGGVNIREDYSYSMNRVQAGIDLGVSPQTFLGIRGRNQAKRYDILSVREYSNEDVNDAGVTLKHYLQPDFAMLGKVSYTTFGYEDVMDIDRGLSVVSYGVGLDRTFNPNLLGSVFVGGSSAEYDNDALDSLNAPVASVSVQVSPSDATRFIGSGAYSIRESTVFPFASQKYTSLSARIEREPSARLDIALTASFGQGEFESESAPEGLADTAYIGDRSGDQTSIQVWGEASYECNRHLTLKLMQLYQDVDSDIFVSYNRNATTLAATIQF